MNLHKSLTATSDNEKEIAYYNRYQDNIFAREMKPEHRQAFANADGNELEKKACAVASSSMLSYNFFHWIDENHPIEIEGTSYTHVEFERQFPCIKGCKCANMDVVLTNNDGDMLCIESKFTEHLKNSKSAISEAYSNCERTCGIDWSSIVDYYKSAAWYQGGLKQNISHLVALNRYVREGRIEKTKLKFVNVIFQPDKSAFKKDYDKDRIYRYELANFQECLNKTMPSLDVKLDKVLTYRQIFEIIAGSNCPRGLIDYLNRYMKYHH